MDVEAGGFDAFEKTFDEISLVIELHDFLWTIQVTDQGYGFFVFLMIMPTDKINVSKTFFCKIQRRNKHTIRAGIRTNCFGSEPFITIIENRIIGCTKNIIPTIGQT
ncbi:MAG: hypothetical protein ACI94Y_003815 [Maribacter sp.]|jgi:hypothetical protein